MQTWGRRHAALRWLLAMAMTLTIFPLTPGPDALAQAPPSTLEQDGPELSVDEPVDGLVTDQQAVWVRGRAQSPVGIDTVTVNGAAVELDENGFFAVRVLVDEGDNVITVRAVDTGGGETTDVRKVIADWTPPALENVEPAHDVSAAWGQDLAIRFTSEAGLTAAFLVVVPSAFAMATDDLPRGTPMAEVEPGVYEGTYTVPHGANFRQAEILIEAYDAAGNVGRVTAPGRLSVGPSVPVLTISDPEDGLVTNRDALRVTGTAADDQGIAQVTVNGRKAGVGSDGRFSAGVLLSEGVNEIVVAAENTMGLVTTVVRTVTADWTPPELEDMVPARELVLEWGESTTLRFSAEPGLDAAYQIIIGGSEGTWTGRGQPPQGTPMEEVSPGVYEAEYTAPAGARFSEAVVRFSAVDAAENWVMTTAPGRLTVVERHTMTQPRYSYAEAVRERVWVESSVDSDGDGEPDLIATDIIRPRETESGLKVPSIIDASPYYASLGRGRESQKKDPNNPPQSFPLFYDNYFVPRGYAVVLPSVAGTDQSTGCPDVGGEAEIQGMKAVIDWLNGRARAFDASGEEVVAYWSTGKAGMIGKSWDGTIANGVAATGVDGLVTIVPIEAISSWYNYFWSNGVPLSSSVPYLYQLNLARPREVCAHVEAQLNAEWSADGDYIPSFYDPRNYVLNADNVKASVFVVEGLNDYNVKPEQYMNWWKALAERDVPRKIWLSQVGHEDAFDYRRDEWIETLHRWFDYWLHGLDNGIMDEPMADVQHGPDEWATYDEWPHRDAQPVTLSFGSREGGGPGTLDLEPIAGDETMTYTEAYQTGTVSVRNEWTPSNTRLVFLSPPLTEPLHLSGETLVELYAALNRTDSTFSAFLVDYGTDTRVNHENGGGVVSLPTQGCYGEGTEADTGCFFETALRTHTQPFEIVARGWFRARYHQSLEERTPVEPGEFTWFVWNIMATDYVFKPGHRLGIVIAGGDRTYTRNTGTAGTLVTVKLGDSRVTLPIVGGLAAVEQAFGPDERPAPPSGPALQSIPEHHDSPEFFQILDDSTLHQWTEEYWRYFGADRR